MTAGEPTRFLFIRHGETDWNRQQRFQGQIDVPLNATGQAQAALVAGRLATDRHDALFSSDLQRAHDTAEAVATRIGLVVQQEIGLRERHFGRFEGLSFTEIETRWPEDGLRWRRREPSFAPGGGESLEQFSARCVEACTALSERHPGQTILVVAHGGVLDCLYRAATRLPLDAPRSWQLGNASVNRLLYTESGFTLVGWNDAAHLQGE